MSTVSAFVRALRHEDLPQPVRSQLIRILLDHVAVALAGLSVESAVGVRKLASLRFPGSASCVLGKGRICSPVGAAMANAAAASALDLDDGYRPAKGHPGVVVIPAALACAEERSAAGADLLAAVAVGYETALRTAVAWHTTRETYHGSGSWGSVGAAAACTRLAGLSDDASLHALGIAEFHAPLAPTIASVDHPSSVKNAAYWGAVAGLTAVDLATDGFTAPPCTLADGSPSVDSLGTDWWLTRVYFKFMPCCRWAQPAVAGVLALRQEHGIGADEVDRIRVDTFASGVRLTGTAPRTTVDAQYSLPFPAACALHHGHLAVRHVTGKGLSDPHVIQTADRVEMHIDPELESRFPEEALARVTLVLKDGRKLSVGPVAASGDADSPPTDADLRTKFFELSTPVLGGSKAETLYQRILDCAALRDIRELTDLLV